MAIPGWALVAAGGFGVFLVFAGYPLALVLLDVLRRGTTGGTPGSVGGAGESEPTSVSVIVAMRNAIGLLPQKLESLLAQEDHGGALEIVLASDGSTDSTASFVTGAAAGAPSIKAVVLDGHGGKHVAMNAAVEASSGSVLVFTDVDAVLEPGAIRVLVEALRPERIGGVCGRRLIGEPDAFLGDAQTDYVAIDSGLKGIESRSGSITSNDGKLYAIRRHLFRPIPGGVTDDLFASMSVVGQGWRFVYDGRARAWIRTPSRSTRHELSRRRRIVCRSLRGIFGQRAVLNPARTGLYAFGLAVNKIGRRLLPVFLLMIFGGTALLAIDAPWARVALAAQVLAVAAALGQPLMESWPLPGFIKKRLALGHYFVVGNIGTLLGVIDFLTNRKVTRWDPVKAD